ncbi:MAG TPA: hypothetical protein VFL42_10865 [Terriglobales bacterium]|nr:hypothetical protein [Terriglobales bacterium]
MAGLILIWALLDLSVPGVCQSDDLEAAPAGTQQSTMGTQTASPVIGTQPANPADNPDKPGPEDCFCCCSHVAPTQFFNITHVFPFLATEPAYVIGAPHDFSSFLYHPPKA